MTRYRKDFRKSIFNNIYWQKESGQPVRQDSSRISKGCLYVVEKGITDTLKTTCLSRFNPLSDYRYSHFPAAQTRGKRMEPPPGCNILTSDDMSMLVHTPSLALAGFFSKILRIFLRRFFDRTRRRRRNATRSRTTSGNPRLLACSSDERTRVSGYFYGLTLCGTGILRGKKLRAL